MTCACPFAEQLFQIVGLFQRPADANQLGLPDYLNDLGQFAPATVVSLSIAPA